jgi:transposase
MGALLDTLAWRRETFEHPFGTLKQWMNPGAFLMRGLDNVRAAFTLAALAYNQWRAINTQGVDVMMAAIQGDGRRDIGQTDPR